MFALAQLAGGPLYGRLGDLLGERMALIVAFTSAFVSYSLMGIATSVQTLFASRLFSVLMHVMQGIHNLMHFCLRFNLSLMGGGGS